MEVPLPTIGHLTGKRSIRVTEPLNVPAYLPRGKHLLIGQRRDLGSTDALILLGKCAEHTGLRDMFDGNIWLDIRLPHVLFICGKRGSGKSYDLGVLAEGLSLASSSNVTTKDTSVTTILFDTQNQFWSLGVAPSSKLPEDHVQLVELEAWRIQPTPLDNVRLFAPKGDQAIVGTETEFVISPTDIDADDWCGLLQVERYSPMGQCIRVVYRKVTSSGYSFQPSPHSSKEIQVPPKQNYEILDLIECLRRDAEVTDQMQRPTRDAVLWRLESLIDSKLFGEGGIDITDILVPGLLSVFLLRNLDDATKALVVSVVTKRIFKVMGEYHTRRKVARRFGEAPPDTNLPMGVWTIIDEAHVVCPAEQNTAAKPALIEYVKRGRDAGLSLVLATQQPSAIDSGVLSQVDLTIVHRLVLDSDIAAATSRFPARFPSNVKLVERDVGDPRSLIRLLTAGEALVGDAESERGFVIRIRPRVTAHAGDEPEVIKHDINP